MIIDFCQTKRNNITVLIELELMLCPNFYVSAYRTLGIQIKPNFIGNSIRFPNEIKN